MALIIPLAGSTVSAQDVVFNEIPWCTSKAATIERMESFLAEQQSLGKQVGSTVTSSRSNPADSRDVQYDFQYVSSGATRQDQVIAQFSKCGLVRVVHKTYGDNLPPLKFLENAYGTSVHSYGQPAETMDQGLSATDTEAQIVAAVSAGTGSIGWRWANGFALCLGRDRGIERVFQSGQWANVAKTDGRDVEKPASCRTTKQ